MNLIKKWIDKFRETGSAMNIKNREPIPSISLKNETNEQTMHEISNKKMCFHRYKIQLVQVFKEND